MRLSLALMVILAMATPALAADPQIEAVSPPPAISSHFRPLTMTVGGRTKVTPANAPYTNTYAFQWPGVYFEAAFKGPEVYFNIVNSQDRLKVTVDGKAVGVLKKPRPGQYHIGSLSDGPHRIRVEWLSENIGVPSIFAGFAVPPTETPTTPPARTRQIEFIGDSLTLGFGNTSGKVDCTTDEIWAATDTSQAFGPLTAKALKADYQVNALSGRGLVRNFDGVLPGATVPSMYPFILLDHSVTATTTNWQPQLAVIGLGTNDFATPVHAGEAWPDDKALKAAYETAYVAFVKGLRAQYPQAFFVLVSYDGATVQSEVARVVAALNADGETRVAPLAMSGFAATACADHLTTDDHKKAAQALQDLLAAHPDIWPPSGQ